MTLTCTDDQPPQLERKFYMCLGTQLQHVVFLVQLLQYFWSTQHTIINIVSAAHFSSLVSFCFSVLSNQCFYSDIYFNIIMCSSDINYEWATGVIEMAIYLLIALHHLF